MALECGMLPTQFWEGEPRLVNSYIRKHVLELNEFNYKSWLSNLYTYKAIVTSISKVLGDKKTEYFDKPIEELYIDFNKQVLTEEESKNKIDKIHRKRTNYWAKFAKKGGKNGK